MSLFWALVARCRVAEILLLLGQQDGSQLHRKAEPRPHLGSHGVGLPIELLPLLAQTISTCSCHVQVSDAGFVPGSLTQRLGSASRTGYPIHSTFPVQQCLPSTADPVPSCTSSGMAAPKRNLLQVARLPLLLCVWYSHTCHLSEDRTHTGNPGPARTQPFAGSTP